MKKLTMIAAILAAMAFSATAADVFSSNIVGYTKVNVASGLNMLGTQFVNVGDNAALDINSLLTTTDLPGLDAGGAVQTELKIWTGLGYTTYGWLDADDGTGVGLPAWNSKWVPEDMGSIATVDMTAGDGFWLKTTDGATVTFSGQVNDADTVDISVNAGLNLVVNPFPCEMNIQNAQSADLPGLDAGGAIQTELKVWTGLGYTTYGWLDADDGTGVGLPAWNSKWVPEDMGSIANVTIGVGQAFWIKTTAPATLTFTK